MGQTQCWPPENILYYPSSADGLQKDCLFRGMVFLDTCDEYFQCQSHQCNNCQIHVPLVFKIMKAFLFKSSLILVKCFYLLCGVGYKQTWALQQEEVKNFYEGLKLLCLWGAIMVPRLARQFSPNLHCCPHVPKRLLGSLVLMWSLDAMSFRRLR